MSEKTSGYFFVRSGLLTVRKFIFTVEQKKATSTPGP